MANKKLKNLRRKRQELNESGPIGDGHDVGESGAQKGGGPESNKGFDSGKEVGYKSKDDHSRPVPSKHPRDMGVNANGTPKAYSPSNPSMEGAGKTQLGRSVKKVKRNEGAKAGRQEVGSGGDKQGTDKEVELANKVPRSEGSKAGAEEVGEFHENDDMHNFRNKIREAFGLPLTDAKNKGNQGIMNNPPKTGSPEENA
jgi:hypothetical protein